MSNWGKVVFNRHRNHWAVKGTWQGRREYFSQIPSMIGPVTCRTKDLAKELRAYINGDINKGIFNPKRYKRGKPLHIEKYVDKWLTDIKPDISSGTWHGYETGCRLYIIPRLGANFLPDVGHLDLKRLMSSMSHLSAKSKKNVMGCLHTMMEDAKRDGHLSQLPPWVKFKGENEIVDPPIEYLTVEQQIKIVDHIPERHRPIFLFMMGTGCRPSEARALRKEDIKDDYILFTHAFGYKGEFKLVKTKKAEPFPLYQELRDILGMARKTLLQWVFVNPDTGKHYSKDVNRIWNRACDKSGVQRIRLYQAVRHSYACQLLNLGVNEKQISRLLRHSDPRMIKRYAKYEVASLEKAAGKVKRLR